MHRGAAGEDFGEIDLTPLIICKEVPSPEGRVSVQIPYSQLLMQSQCLALGARPVSPTIWFDARSIHSGANRKKQATKIAASPASAVRVLSSRS